MYHTRSGELTLAASNKWDSVIHHIVGQGRVIAGWSSGLLFLLLPQVFLIGFPFNAGLCLPQLRSAAEEA